MNQVDFYILQDPNTTTRHRYACRLADKAYRLGHHIHIYTGSAETSQFMDELLWTFKDQSFIPHEVITNESQYEDDLKVTISHEWVPEHGDVLINLTGNAPEFSDQFQRIIEIIEHDPSSRSAGRERYRNYRETGFILNHHEVTSA